MVRRLAQALLQGVDGGEIERAAAPLQHADLIEGVALQPVDQVGVERRDLAGDAESSVVHMPSSAASDLADLRRGEIAVRLAIEFTDAGEGHVVEIEVEPHADGVGRHQEVHVAVLIEFDLRVAGAGAERAEHDCGPAALPAHQLGNGVDVVDRERDDCRPAGQAGDLLVAGVGELRQARPRHEVRAGKQFADGVAHGGRAKQQRLVEAAGMEQAVGEHMPALGIRRELNLVHGDEVRFELPRHGLDRADIEARRGRLDLLLAGDERDFAWPDAGNNLVVDLARQEPERQADDADIMGKHALDREMGLARVGGPEHGGDAAAFEETCGLRGKGAAHSTQFLT